MSDEEEFDPEMIEGEGADEEEEEEVTMGNEAFANIFGGFGDLLQNMMNMPNAEAQQAGPQFQQAGPQFHQAGPQGEQSAPQAELDPAQQAQAQQAFANLFGGFGNLLNAAAQQEEGDDEVPNSSANILSNAGDLFGGFGNVMASAPVQTPSGTNRKIDPSELLLKKNTLKKVDPNMRGHREKVIGFKEFYGDFNLADYRKFPEEALHSLPIEAVRKVLENSSPPPKVLDFKGLDLVTDFLFYYLYEYHVDLHGDIMAANTVTNIDCSGCRYLTDDGVYYICQLFECLEEIVLDCCPLLTEKSLLHLLELSSLKSISMKATSVSVVPYHTLLAEEPNLSLVLDGCPLHTPFPTTENLNSIAKGEWMLGDHMKELAANHKLTEKIMVINPHSLYSFSHWLVTSELKEWTGPCHYEPALKIPVPDGVQSHHFPRSPWKDVTYNVMEINGDHQDLEHLFLSKNHLVIIPYHLSKFASQEEVQNWMVAQHSRLCKNKIMFVCLLEEGVGKDISLEQNAVNELIVNRRADMLLEPILQKRETLVSPGGVQQLKFSGQQEYCYGTFGRKEENIFLLDVDMGKKKGNEEFCDKLNKKFLEINEDLNPEIKIDWIASSQLVSVTRAVQRLGVKQGIWTFSELYKTLLADDEGRKLDNSGADSKSKDSSKKTLDRMQSLIHLHLECTTGPLYKRYQKALERIHKQGLCLYFPDIKDQPVIVDFTWLKNELSKLLSKNDSKIPFSKDNMSSKQMTMLYKVLEKKGLLIRRPKEYLVVEKLPMEPELPMEFYWSDSPASNELQLSKCCNLLPDMPTGFFAQFLRTCAKVAANPVIWRDGLLAQHGAITLLIERRVVEKYTRETDISTQSSPKISANLKKLPSKAKKKGAPLKKAAISKKAAIKISLSEDEEDEEDEEIAKDAELKPLLPEGTTMIYLAVRTTKLFDKSVTNQHAMKLCLWSTLLTYISILKYVCQQFKVYSQLMSPCPHGKYCDSRTKFYHHSLLTDGEAASVRHRLECGECKEETKVEDILGPNDYNFVKPGGIAPTHTQEQIKFNAEAHVDYSICFLCGNCAYEGIDCPHNGTHGETMSHCGCKRNALLCSKCGVCTKCTKFLNKIQTSLQPGLSSSQPFALVRDKFAASDSIVRAENLSRGNYVTNQRSGMQRGSKWATLDPVHFNFFEVTILPDGDDRNGVTIGLVKASDQPLLEYNLKEGTIFDCDSNETQERPEWVVKEACTIRVQMRFDRDDQCRAMDSEKVKIEILRAGEVIFTKRTRFQRLYGIISTRGKHVELFVNAPGIKEGEMTPSRRLKKEMLLEYRDPNSGVHHLVCVKSVSHDHYSFYSVMEPENKEEITLDPYSDKVFPVYYSYYNGQPSDYWKEVQLDECPECQEKCTGKRSACEVCGTSLKKMKLLNIENLTMPVAEWINNTRVPIWLFPETQRTNMKPYHSPRSDPGLSRRCNDYLQGAAQTACIVAQHLHRIEDRIFADGEFNYSGSMALLIPSVTNQKLTKMLPYVRQEALTKGSMKVHPLCYARGDAGEMLMARADYKLDREHDGKFWQLHLVDSPGWEFDEDELVDMFASLIISHALVGSQKVELPSHKKILPGFNISQAEAEDLIQSVVRMVCQSILMMMVYHQVKGFEPYLLDKLLPDTRSMAWGSITNANTEKVILEEHDTMTGDTHYLCGPHLNCYLVEKELQEFPMEKFKIDGMSYSSVIRSLRIPKNNIKVLPDDFFISFPSLVDFDVSRNELSVLPRGIGKCKMLCGINVKGNSLTVLPEELKELKDQPLKLEISENRILEIPEVVCQLENLRRFTANKLLLTSLPESFGNLKNLEFLSLKNNCLQVLPASFKKLKKLKSLSLEGMPWFKHKPNRFLSLEEFDEFLKGTYAERWLELHKEDKASLYEFFDEDSNGLLDEKEIAKMSACLFHMFPRFRGTEEESGIPSEIMELENLEYLDLQYQGITHIPDSISKLRKLNTLVVSSNPCLETISPLTGRLPLKRLVLDECPSLRTPPKEIISKGFQTIYAYLRRLISGSVECKRTKLMLVGLGGVGKTSLVKAIMSGSGVAGKTEDVPQVTDGIDICNWTVTREDETVSYSVWDFAGQTVYYNTHQFFLSDRSVYFLLWNIRQGHEHAGLDFWLNSIAVHAPKAPILVVGTHLDEVSKVEIPVEEMQEKYSQIKGFHFVSSRSGQGIAELQEKLLDVTLEQTYMGEQIPQMWLNLEKEIVKLRTTESVVSYNSVEDLALAKTGIFDKSEVSQAVQFLHELGSVQHFDNNFLKSHVVINPQWIVDVMACVVSINDYYIVDGNFKHIDIPKVWADFPSDLHGWLLRLTEEYDLTFQLKDQPVNLVPCLLPERQPSFQWPELDKENGEREVKMVYKFDYLPAGLFNRAQVRLYEFSDSSVIWKRGSRLKKNGHIALLTQLRDQELHVKVQGPTPENVLFLVHEVFEGLITESFQGVVYDYHMPCPDCTKAHARDPHMFAASSIRRATQLKAPFLQCAKYFHVIPLSDLHSMMPPENNADYDLQLVQTVRGLTDLRKDMTADIFISYCAADVPRKGEQRVAPADICRDLEEAGYRCWFQEDPSSQSLEVTAIALRDARVFLACISDNYIQDQECCSMFKYASTTLKKSIVLVVLGNSMNWQQSQIGLLVAGELYVNMQRKDRYTDKLQELARKLDVNTLLKKEESIEYPPVFISYAWANSARAVALGTGKKEGAAGFGDPRDYKDHLEKNGIKCWLDVEQVGANGLFEDIAVGLQNAKVLVACISDQYAESANCNMEFRFAKTALNLPIIVVTVGRGQNWRKSEVGMLSINYPLVSHDDCDHLIQLVKERLPSGSQQQVSDESKEKKKQKELANQQQKNTSFQELYELAQRKFLRQVGKLADSFNMDPYPRLIVIDHVDTAEEEEEKANTRDTEINEEQGQVKLEEEEMTRPQTASKQRKDHSLQHGQKHCFRVLCEHEEGWHITGDPIDAPNVNDTLLHKLIPYLVRIMAIVRHSKHITLSCISGDRGEKYFKWLEEAPRSTISEWQEVYRELLQEVVKADKNKTMAHLARCHLPSGKVAWLCEEHRSHGRITILSAGSSVTTGTSDTGMENFMLKALQAPENQVTLKYKTQNETKMAAVMKDKDKALKAEEAKSRQVKMAAKSSTPVLPSGVNPVVAATVNAMTLGSVQKTAADNKDKRARTRFKAAGIAAAASGQKKNSSQACDIL